MGDSQAAPLCSDCKGANLSGSLTTFSMGLDRRFSSDTP